MTPADDMVIFTVANRRYEPFVLPYIASALAHNPGALVEIGLEDAGAFAARNADALDRLNTAYPGAFTLRNAEISPEAPNSARFLSETETRRAYLYIGDIDILILEEIASIHLKLMAVTGLPYSNILRQGRPKMSGLHFTRTEAFYPLPAISGEIADEIIRRDEYLLYEIIRARGLAMPPADFNLRPIHGFHLSLNRRPTAARGLNWSIDWHPMFVAPYIHLTESPLWRALFPLFDPPYQRLAATLDFILETKFPDAFAEHDRSWLSPRLFFDH